MTSISREEFRQIINQTKEKIIVSNQNISRELSRPDNKLASHYSLPVAYNKLSNTLQSSKMPS